MNIQQVIDKHLKEKQELRNERTPSGKFVPSSFGQCFRRQIWRRLGEKETNPPDSRLLRVFHMGSVIHETIYDLIKEEEHATEVEIDFIDDVKGFADIVTKDMVIDLKSCHSRKFWYLGRKKEETEEEAVERFHKQQYDNILQVMTYCVFLNRPLGKLVYISRDDWSINEYVFEVEAWRDAVNNELIVLRKWWEKKELPPAKPRCYPQKDGSLKECSYCPFLDKCREVGNGKA